MGIDDKTRHSSTIVRRVKVFLKPGDPSAVRVADNVSDHVHGGNIRALAGPLNTSENFAKDGMSLAPDDLNDVVTVKQLILAIIKWYEDNGWTINKS